MNLTYGSVCSGIEAASVAWHPLGWQPAWFAEIEQFPSTVLAHHYPTVPNLGDMTKIAAMVRAGHVCAPDVLVGGTPCQAFSIAGLRASLDDARGQLTLSFVDLANAIDTARYVLGEQPAIIVWENVPGVLSTNDNAFGCFLGALSGEDDPLVAPGGKWANAGCVFGPQRTVAWRVCDSQYFGVAQRRRRVFVVASARKWFDPTEVLFELDGVRRDSAPSRQTWEDAAGTIAGGARSRGGHSNDDIPLTAGTLRASDGGANIDQAMAGHVLTCVSNAEGSTGLPFLTCSNIAKTVNNQTPLMSFEEVAAPAAFSTSGAGYWREGIGALRGRPQDSHENLTVAPIAFDSRQDCVSSTEVFGALGSSSPQAQAVCVTGEVTHTLKAEGFDASEDGTGSGQPIVAAFQSSQSGIRLGDTHATLDANNEPRRHNGALVGMAVRRLTPRECERLQAFPDDYTLIPYGRVVKLEKLERDWIKYLLRGGVMTLEQVCQAAADGPRYKALGNSMCTRNMAWIGRRIELVLSRQLAVAA